MKKYGKPILIGLLVTAALLWWGGRWVLSFSVAQESGSVSITAVRQPVQITFDKKGIPQIWAQSDADMYTALGWVHAGDRLFQMELVRRLVRGRLAELFGPAALPLDIRQQRIGFARKAQADLPSTSPPVIDALQNYCNGINAWIHSKSIMPPEFVALRLTPADWTVEDCLAIAVYQSWYSHSLMAHDGEYERLINTLGERLSALLLQHQDWSPSTVTAPLSGLFGGEEFPLRMGRASNSWAISPKKSASGAAIHASDPHLQVNQIPGFWYIVGLHSAEGPAVLGVSAPGLPLVVMGHTDSIAFSFTVASVDLMDYYRWKRHPQDSLQILTADGYQAVQVDTVLIPVKDEPQPRRVAVYQAPNGPVIDGDSLSLVSLRWAGFDFHAGAICDAALQLRRATDFQTFRRTVTAMGALDVNWIYSDINGNIGYQLGSPVPRRAVANTYSTLAGELPENHWQGYYPLAETPAALNPPRGWLATCNNQITPAGWPYAIPGFYDPFRIVRAKALLEADESFTVAEVQAMQLDRISVLAGRYRELMARGADRLNRPQLSEEIRGWAGEMNEDDRLPALFALWWRYMGKALFEDELGAFWEDGARVQDEVLDAGWAEVVDDHRTAEIRETREDLSARALEEVTAEFSDPYYKQVSRLTKVHPLSRVKILNEWLGLNRGPFAAGGDKSTLSSNFNKWNERLRSFEMVAGPSMRFVLDWSDIDGFTINSDLGQSGNPLSPHYDDFLKMMRSGERWTVPFSREKVFAGAGSVLTLQPATAGEDER